MNTKMQNFLQRFFRSKKPIPPKKDWPEHWSVQYKEYARPIATFRVSGKTSHKKSDVSLREALSRRHTSRDFVEGAISGDDILELLTVSLGEHDKGGRRAYPSGGGLYPIETYYMNMRATSPPNGLPRGLYHFAPHTHELRLIRHLPVVSTSVLLGSSYTFLDHAQGVLVFSVIPRRNTEKYGMLGIRLGLVEVGAMTEHIYLVGESLGLGVCAIAGFDGARVDETLGVDGVSEASVLVVAIGKAGTIPRGHTS